MAKDNMIDNLDGFLNQMKEHPTIEISKSWGNFKNLEKFNEESQIFNRRLQFKPFVIVYCEKEKDVEVAYKASIDNNLPVRVRAGGHDHEGECTGTDTILLDLSKMQGYWFKFSTLKETEVGIGPGFRFIDLTSLLADEDVMIAHGTCATVGISGYTLGGGWGPWTRKYGMGCERLIGARIMNGQGVTSEVRVSEDNEVPDLLWALRGGGGMSYGIVTEFIFKAFKLPCEMHRFVVEINPYKNSTSDELIEQMPTLQALKKWEGLIEWSQNKELTGTNLKINAIHQEKGHEIDENVHNNCAMFGYWEGDLESVEAFIKKHFPEQYEGGFYKIEDAVGACYKETKYGHNLMSAWDRESNFRTLKRMTKKGLLQGTPLQPDEDEPAPHKITSRLVNEKGLDHNNENGYMELLQSLSSHLVLEGNRAHGLFTYVTLGAIQGEFYGDPKNRGTENKAFPYADCQYTIQYQCWWNTTEDECTQGQDNFVYDRTNRALDWIEASRDAKISNTHGAFISFKDSSIPTEIYFDKSYSKLKSIKESNLVQDEYNHLRTRKTII
ncbi:MAG: hypothetical protein Crog4KO_16920 [Crocinitomicaceae bacterium]